MLEVVEQEQHLPVRDRRGQVACGAEGLGGRVDDEPRVPQRREVDEEDTVRVCLDRLGGGLEREPALAAPADARQGHEPDPGPCHQPDHLGQLPLPAQERRRLDREIRPVEARERREVAVAELEESLGRPEILEPVLAQVAQALVEELRGRLRHEHLASVARRGDACGAMDVDADVPLVRRQRLARVQPGPNANRAVAERLLELAGSRDRVAGPAEGDEERIALRVHLVALVCRERRPQESPMVGQGLRVPLGPQLVQEPRGALDVREQEGDGSRGPRGHGVILNDPHLAHTGPSQTRRRLRPGFHPNASPGTVEGGAASFTGARPLQTSGELQAACASRGGGS